MGGFSVRPMTDGEYEVWRSAEVEVYAAEQVDAGNWAAEGAVERALAEHAELLPDGPATDGMLLLVGVDGDGHAVGVLWIALKNPRGTPDCAFIYDIEVHEQYRGLGHGRSLLAAAEETVLALGMRALMLNVFGENRRAISLYESAGYAVVTKQMRKDLGR